MKPNVWKMCVLEGGIGPWEPNCAWKGSTLANHFWCGERVIKRLSCGIQISAVGAFSMLSDRCLSCPALSVCDLGVLRPNGSMDQDKTWPAGRPQPWPRCVDPAPIPKRGTAPSPIFGPYLLWPMAGWIKMPLGKEVGLGPGDFVLDGDPAPPPKKGAQPPICGLCLLCPNGWM